MAVTASQFLQNLEASRLVSADEIAELRAGSDVASLDAQTLAVRLVQKQRLTAYQAKQLLAGRWRGFFLEKYKILEPIGQGGMGMVFKAEHTALRRVAAIKVLPSRSATNRDAVTRFEREARAAAHLEHENIVRVYDVGQGDAHFIALEFVPGTSLSKLLKERGRLAASEAATIGYQVALGLEHAFERGIIHRDVKPSNIMITPQGKAKILDMGLARFFGDSADPALCQASLTVTGAVVGTVDYVAPEQAEDSSKADTRSDIYSLGCTIYHCLTNQPPFPDGSVVQRLLRHREHDPMPISLLAPDVPDALMAIVRRMMAKQPADRYQTPAEVAEALVPFLTPSRKVVEVALPSPAPGEARTGRSSSGAAADSRMQPGSSTVPSSPAASVTAAGVVATSPRTAGATISDMATNDVLEAIATAAAQSPPQSGSLSGLGEGSWTRLRTVLATSLIATVLLLLMSYWYWSNTNVGTLLIKFPPPDPAAGSTQGAPADTRLLIDGLRRTFHGQEHEEIRLSAGPHALEIEWTGYAIVNRVVSIRRREVLPIELAPKPETTRRLELADLTKRVQAGVPDNPAHKDTAALRQQLVAYVLRHRGTSETATAADLRARLRWPADVLRREYIPAYELGVAGNGDPQKAPASLVAILGDSRLRHWGPVVAAAFGKEGKTLFTGGEDGTLRFWDTASGQQQAVIEGYARGGLALSPDGSTLASGGAGVGDQTVKLWNVASRQRRVLEGHTANVLCVAFSDDGKTLASGGIDGTVRLWDFPAGTTRQTLPGNNQAVRTLAFSPDGKTLAAGLADGTVTIWDVETSAKRHTTPPAHKDGVNCVAFYKDSHTLVSGGQDDKLKIWNASTGDEQDTLRGHAGGCLCLTFQPNGQILASSGRDNTIRLWDLAKGEERRAIEGHLGPVESMAFSPDGHTLASGSRDHSVKLWEVARGRERHLNSEDAASILCAALNPTGDTLALGSDDTIVRLWDVTSAREWRKLQGQQTSHMSAITRIAFSPDGRILASASFDPIIKIWDTASWTEGKVLVGHKDEIWTLAFSPDGKTLASGGKELTVRIWDVSAGLEQKSLAGHKNWVNCLVFSIDGQTLVSGSQDKTMSVWSLSKEKPTVVLDQHKGAVFQVTFSPDGKTFASESSDGTLRLFGSGYREQNLTKGTMGYCLAFSPDGHTVVFGGSDGKLQFCDARSGQKLDPITIGPSGGTIRQAIYTPDGRHLITVNGNGTIYILRLERYSPP